MHKLKRIELELPDLAQMPLNLVLWTWAGGERVVTAARDMPADVWVDLEVALICRHVERLGRHLTVPPEARIAPQKSQVWTFQIKIQVWPLLAK